MNYQGKLVQGFIALLILLLLTSCATEMRNIIHDKSFTVASVTKEKFIFLGLISRQGYPSVADFTNSSYIALNALRDKRHDITIDYNPNLMTAMGDEFNNIVSKLRSGDVLNQHDLSQLKDHNVDYRYILLSRIDYDNIDESSEYTDVNSIFTVKRELAVHTEVYDLQHSLLVWSGNINTELSNVNTNPHKNNSNVLKDILTTVVENEVYGTTPATPRIEKLIENSFKGIAENLPRQSCSEVGYFNCFSRSI